MYSFNHAAQHYEKILARSHPDQTFILMFALDQRDRNVPAGCEDLLPLPWSEIEAKLKNGETVELQGSARSLKTVLLAAPTSAALARIIQLDSE